jgi:hypothetical protein
MNTGGSPGKDDLADFFAVSDDNYIILRRLIDRGAASIITGTQF